MKKALIVVGSIIALIFVALILIPVLFKDQIKTAVLEEVNNQIDAEVALDDFSVSIFSHFPNVTADMQGLSVIGKDVFAGDTLMAFKHFEATVNLMSLISGDKMDIKGIYLDEATINVLVLEDGRANYDITKPEEEVDTTASQFNIGIQEWRITKTNITYEDRSSNMYAAIKNLNHEGKGDFTQDIIDLMTKTTIDELTYKMGGISYLNKGVLDADLNMKLDLPKSMYTFTDNNIKLNDFSFGFTGDFQQVDTTTMEFHDLKFEAHQTTFKSLLSLVPGVFLEGFDNIKTDGNLEFNGVIDGVMNDQRVPSFALNLVVENASFQYPDLEKVKNIGIDLHIKNEDGLVENTKVNLNKFHMDMGKNPIDASALISKAMEPTIIDKALVSVKVDLADILKIYPVEGYDIKGIFKLDADVHGKYDDNTLPYVKANMDLKKGYVNSADLKDIGPLENVSFDMTANNVTGELKDMSVDIKAFDMKVAGDRFHVNGTVKNFDNITYDMNAKGGVNLDLINELAPMAGVTIKGKMDMDINTKGKMSDIEPEKYENLPTSGSIVIKDFLYADTAFEEYMPGGVTLKKAKFDFSPKAIDIPVMKGSVDKTNFNVTGTISNYIAYALGSSTNNVLYAKLDADADYYSYTMVYEEGEEEEVSPDPNAEPDDYSMPRDLDIVMNVDLKKMDYIEVEGKSKKTIPMKNLKGQVIVRDGRLYTNDFSVNVMGGLVALNGFFDGTNVKKPSFDYGMEIEKAKISDAYSYFNSVQKLAPMAEALEGTFSLKGFKTKGDLTSELDPIYEAMHADGKMTLEEVSFKPSELDAYKTLKTFIPKLSQYDEVKIIDKKVNVEVEDGHVKFSPFDFKIGDMEFQVTEGKQGISGNAFYAFTVKDPDGGIKVPGLGSSLNEMDFVMEGPYEKMKVKPKTDRVKKMLADQAKDKAKDEASDKLNNLVGGGDKDKENIKDALENTKEEIKEETDKAKEEAKKKAEEELKKEADKKKKDVIKGLGF